MIAKLVLTLLGPGKPWGEACAFCKSYPNYDQCICSWQTRLRRWARQEASRPMFGNHLRFAITTIKAMLNR